MFPVVHNKPIAGKMCSSSSSLEKCSSNFLTFYHNDYDDSNLANYLEILLDEVYVPVVSKTDMVIS